MSIYGTQQALLCRVRSSTSNIVSPIQKHLSLPIGVSNNCHTHISAYFYLHQNTKSVTADIQLRRLCSLRQVGGRNEDQREIEEER